MTDLVKRLRDRFTYDELHYAPDLLLAEAADRIEELEGWKAAEEAHHHLLKRRIEELEAVIREITGT
jgi:hypothetical protein